MIIFKSARTGKIASNEKQIELMRSHMRETVAKRRLTNPPIVEGQTIFPNSPDSFIIGDSTIEDKFGED